MALWLVLIYSGRSIGHLLVGLYNADALQSPLLFVPSLFRIRHSHFHLDILLRVHFPVHRSLFQGNDPADYDKRWQDIIQQNDRVVP